LEPPTAWENDRRSTTPETVADETKIEIPGVSENSTYFSDIFHLSKGVMPSVKYEEQPQHLNKELMDLRQGMPSTAGERNSDVSREKFGIVTRLQEKTPVKAKTDGFLPHEMPAVERDVSLGQTGTSAVELVSEIGSMPNSRAAFLSNAQAMDDTMDPTPSAHRTIRNSKSGIKMDLFGDTGTFNRHELSTGNNFFSIVSKKTPDVFTSPYVGANAVNKSNKDAYDRIEQLRNSVHELASKASSQQAMTYNEIKSNQSEQPPLPPVQPVVIVRQSATQNRTSCAFWERSYLSHFHLRPLR
jgi:hypothetical protein